MAAGCAQTVCASSFVARLAPDGRSLRWATLFDGGYGTWIQDLAVDAAGDVAMVGSTTRAGFPTTLGALGAAGRTTPGGHRKHLRRKRARLRLLVTARSAARRRRSGAGSPCAADAACLLTGIRLMLV